MPQSLWKLAGAAAAVAAALRAAPCAAAADEFVQVEGGVVLDEGNSVGDFAACDLECCKAKCRATATCNSFATSSLNCYLKDKCVYPDTPAKKSAYKTFYRPCPESGMIEATCGAWAEKLSADSDGFAGDTAAAVAAFADWQNCVVQAAQDGQAARRPLQFAVYRPTASGSPDENTVAGAAGRLRGLLSTVAFAMVTGRVFLLDWPALAQGNLPAFEPLDGVLRSDFATLAGTFKLRAGDRLAAAATAAGEGVQWMCGTDLRRVDKESPVLVFSSTDDFMGFAAYNPSISAEVELVLGPRSLASNPLADLYAALLRPTPTTAALTTAAAAGRARTVGVLLQAGAGGATSDDSDADSDFDEAAAADSDGVFEDFSANADSLAGCVAQATTAAAAAAAAMPALAVVDQTFSGGAAGPTGVAVGTAPGAASTGFEFTQLAAPAQHTTALQVALRKVAVLAACDELLVAGGRAGGDRAGDAAAAQETTFSFGLSHAAPVEWVPNAAAAHRPAATCAPAATAKARSSTAVDVPLCSSWFPTEKHEEMVLHYVE